MAFCASMLSACFLLAAGPFLGPSRAQESLVVEKNADRPIDNDRVARDLDEATKNKGTVSVWSFNERSKSTLEALPVPLFLPAETVSDLAAGSEQSKGVLKQKSEDGADTRIMSFEDEVFVVRSFDKYRVTIQGTRKSFSDEGGTSKAAPKSASDDYYAEFAPTYGGGQINFGYAGADYLVEFECKEGGVDCITPAEAQRVFASLALCSTDGRCVDNGTEFVKKLRR